MAPKGGAPKLGFAARIKNLFSKKPAKSVENGDNIVKNAGTDLKDLPTSVKSADDFSDAVGSLGKSKQALNPEEATNIAKTASKRTDKEIADAMDSSVAEVANAKKTADTFWKRNEKTLMALGITTGGIAALMLLTGESNPGTLLGDQVGNIAGGVGEGLGKGLGAAVGGAVEGSGLGEFFSDWGLYIGIGCFVILMLAVLMMLK